MIMETKRPKKSRVGVVIGNKMHKTAVVEVIRRHQHAVFKKYYQKTKRFKVHDENNECGVGDVVQISECNPISKTKSWRLDKIIEKAVD